MTLPQLLLQSPRPACPEQVEAELKEVRAVIKELKSILASKPRRMGILKSEMAEVVESFGDERRTEIVADQGEFTVEDLIGFGPKCLIRAVPPRPTGHNAPPAKKPAPIGKKPRKGKPPIERPGFKPKPPKAEIKGTKKGTRK